MERRIEDHVQEKGNYKLSSVYHSFSLFMIFFRKSLYPRIWFLQVKKKGGVSWLRLWVVYKMYIFLSFFLLLLLLLFSCSTFYLLLLLLMVFLLLSSKYREKSISPNRFKSKICLKQKNSVLNAIFFRRHLRNWDRYA